MRLATACAFGFAIATGSEWVFGFLLMWYTAICLEKLAKQSVSGGDR